LRQRGVTIREILTVIARRLSLLLLLATASAAAASTALPEESGAPARIGSGLSTGAIAPSARPRPLRGVPLRGSTGLRLLVANNPPFLLDVDSGRRTRITGLKLGRQTVLGVRSVGRDAIVWVDRFNRAMKAPRAQIYVVRRCATRATRLATAWEVAPAADGLAVWLKSYEDAAHCALRELALDGSERQSPRAVSCSVSLVDSGSGALLVDGSSVLDPSTGETLLEAGDLWAVVEDFAITTDGSQGPLTVTNLRSRERFQLRYPSRIAGQGGTDEAAPHPNGRLVALSVSDPAYQFSGTQVTDVWLLDLATRRLRHLPDMPAAVSLKRTSMQWTSDGRLVMLAEVEDRNVVAVWRPGRKRIRVRPVRLPARNSGSDSFVVWRAARP
jgi:hypothetical protein